MKLAPRALALLATLILATHAPSVFASEKKTPPIALPMYEEAYENLRAGNPAGAIKPLTHLAKADAKLPDVQNALALALFMEGGGQQQHAFPHAENALALDPNRPRFIVTHVLTDRTQWKIEEGGTARLSRDGAERLMSVSTELIGKPGKAGKLGALLNSIMEQGDDPDFPFVFTDYSKLVRTLSLALTFPPTFAFDVAQKSIVEKIASLAEKLDEQIANQRTDPAKLVPDEVHTHRSVVSPMADFEAGKAAMDRSDYGLAFHIWLSLARAGDTRAMNYLGLMYENCLGVRKNSSKATYWSGLSEHHKNTLHDTPEHDPNCVYEVKKAPPIALPMYLEAYTSIIFRKSAQAIKPLTYLVEADPHFADFQNALALALFVVWPEQREHAAQHAEKALTLAPNVPQFIVTHVLTNRSLWKFEADGTARMNSLAAERLLAVRHHLRDMSGNASQLGKLLYSIIRDDDDPDYPFVFTEYYTLLKNPRRALTRPNDEDFDFAQRAMVDNIYAQRQLLQE